MHKRTNTKVRKNGIKSHCTGVLLPVSALPSKDGFGTFSKSAFRFIDFLYDAGQRIWQILPLNPVDAVGSPYNSASAFAIDPLYIDIGDTEYIPEGKSNREYFSVLRKNRTERLYDIFKKSNHVTESKLLKFARKNKFWIWEYCVFQAFCEHFRTDSFENWPNGLSEHDLSAVQKYVHKLRESVRFHLFMQYTAHSEWQCVRRYARKKGVYILGDMPFYAAKNSADVWAHGELFNTSLSAGVPPDYFSEYGQKWNTPVYDWEKGLSFGLNFWKSRAERSAELYDMVRIDHFRAIESYYAVPADAPDARGGDWHKGPNRKLIDVLIKIQRRGARFVAEDLGTITPEVRELLDYSGFPGMSVLQFAFDGNSDNPHLPFSVGRNRLLYTGTHDNQTLSGWVSELSDGERKTVSDYFGVADDENAVFGIIDSAMASDAGIFIVPMQDYLGLSDDCRINTPGVTDGNWRFSLNEIPNERLAQRMRELAVKHGRISKGAPIQRS